MDYKKPLIFLFTFMFLISFASALSFDNIKSEKSITFDGKSINDNALLQKYKPIEIANNFGFGSNLFEGYLSKHDESCGVDCESIIEIKLGSDSPLIDAVEFLTLQEDGSWIKQPVRSYQFYIKTENKQIDVDDYETQCVETGVSANGTVIQECSQVLVGSHKEDAPVWTPYNVGDEMPKGTYTVKLEADKKPTRTVDWVITTQGRKINEWAVWGSGIIYDAGTKTVTTDKFNVTFGTQNIANITFLDSGATVDYFATGINNAGTIGYAQTASTINSFEVIEGPTNYLKINLSYEIQVNTGGSNPIQKVNETWEFYSTTDWIKITTFGNQGSAGSGDWNKFYGWKTQSDNINYINTSGSWVTTTASHQECAGNCAEETTLLGQNGTYYAWADERSGWFYGMVVNNTLPVNNVWGGWARNDAYYNPIDSRKYGVGLHINNQQATFGEIVSYLTYSNDRNDLINIEPVDGGLVTLNSPSNGGIETSTLVTLNASATVTGGATLVNTTNYIWYSNNTLVISNTTLGLSGTSDSRNFSVTLSAGESYKWNREYCDSDGDCGFAPSNYTFSIDNVAPSVILNYPTSLIDYGANGGTLQLNFTATDSNLDEVWYNYNGTNITIAGATSGVTNLSNITLSSKKNVTIYANDTAGNLNATTFSWDYKVFTNSQTYNAITRAGSIEDYELNITLGSGISLTSANLIYGNQTLSTAIYSSGQNRSIRVDDYETPLYSVDTNVSFYWNLSITGGSVQTQNSTQLIQAILLDNCSTYTFPLFNLSLFDEQLKTPLFGDIQIDYQLLNKPNYGVIQSLTYGLTNKTNSSICAGINLSNEDIAYSAEIRYVSDGYAPELYHIQRADIGSSVQTLKLYDLNLNESTEFKIVYQDNDYSFVEGAVIQLQRKYISEGIYEIVEAPLTSNEGTAIVHIDLNSNKYKATVVKNGEVLDIFDNLVFICESPLTGQCTQQLLGTINPQNSLDLNELLDFSYTNPTIVNETISITFTIPSGAPSTVNMVLTQKDQFGNTTLCNETITSSAGSIECDFDKSIGDSFLELEIYKNGELILQSTYVIPEEGVMDFLGNNFFIVLILMLSLVGMAVTSPEWIIVNGIITFVIAGSIWLLNGLDFVVGLGSLMWLLIAGAILLFKLAKQEDR